MIDLRTLGGVTILVSGEDRRLTVDKQAALLVYLSLNQGRPQRRERVAGLLWDGVALARARQSLSQALYSIRKRIPEPIIIGNSAEIWVPDGAVRVDALRLRAAVAADRLEEAAELYTGEFLADLWVQDARGFEEWQFIERRELTRIALQVFHTLLRRAIDEGEWLRVIHYTSRILKIDPQNEPAIRARIEAIAANEGRQTAWEEYERAIRSLTAEGGRKPEEETRRLGERLRDGIVVIPDTELDEHRTQFIGRRTEYSRLSYDWDQALSRQGRARLVSGEPGIGKSRLSYQFLRLAAVRGGRIFLNRCQVTDQKVPYSGISNTLMAGLRPDDLESLGQEWTSVLANLLPEIRAIVPNLEGVPHLEGEGDRRRLFESLTQLFIEISDTSPIVIFIDDLQWSDPTSVAVLHYLLPRITDHPIMILLSTRPEGVVQHIPPELILDEEAPGPGYRPMSLGPIAYEDLRELATTLSEGGAQSPTEAECAEVYNYVGGRPYFFIEIIRAIAEGEIEWETSPGPAIRGEGFPLPDRVESFGARLIKGLDPDSQVVSAALAVIGTAADPSLVAEVGMIGTEALLRGIEDLVRRGLIEETGSELDFTHHLIREFAYRSIGRSRRRALHLSAAELLSSGDGVEERVIALHYDAAGVKRLAYSHAMMAVGSGASGYASQEVEALLRIARSNALDLEEKALATESLAHTLLARGRYDEATEYLSELIDLEPIRGDHERFLRARVGLVTVAVRVGRTSLDELDQRIADLIDDARSNGTPDLLAELVILRTRVQKDAGNSSAVLSNLERLRSVLDEISDDHQRVRTLTAIAALNRIYFGAEIALPIADDAVELASQIDEGGPLITALATRGLCYLMVGMEDLAEDDLRRARSLSESGGEFEPRQAALNTLGIVLLAIGRYEEATSVLDEAIEEAVGAGALRDLQSNRTILLLVERERGNREAATALAQEIIDTGELASSRWSMVVAASTLGLYALEDDDLQAAEYNRRLVKRLTARGDLWGLSSACSEIFLARLQAMEGELAGASARLERALAIYIDRCTISYNYLRLERARQIREIYPGAKRRASRPRSTGRYPFS